MKKQYNLSTLMMLMLVMVFASSYAQEKEIVKVDRYTQNFSSFDVNNPAKIFSETRAFADSLRAPYTFSLESGALRVDVDKNFVPTSGNNNFVSFRYNISVDSMTVVDMNEYPYMSFKVKASAAIPYRVQLFEPNATVNANGAMNRAALETSIPAADEWVTIFVDLTDKFIHVTNSNLDTVFIEDHSVFQFLMVPNFGATGATWQGTVWVDDIKLGKAAAPKTLKNTYTQNFTTFTIDPAKIFSEKRAFADSLRAPYTFSHEAGALRVDVDKNFVPTSGNNNFVSFRYNISVDSMTVVDMNEYPYMSFKVKASAAIPFRVQLFEPYSVVNASGAMNRAALETSIPAADEWVTIFVDLTGKFIHVTNSNLDTVFIKDQAVFQFLMVPNFGATGATWQGTIWVDDIKLGKAAAPKTLVDTYTQDFSNFVIDPAKIFSETRAFADSLRAPYTFSLENNALRVDVDKNFAPTSGNNNFVSFRYNISVDSMTVVDMNEYPFMSFKVKASAAIPFRVQLFEPYSVVNASGAMNRAALETSIPAADEWVTIFVDLTDKFIHVTNSNLDTVFIKDQAVFQFLMVPNFGATGATWQGTIWVDDIKLGKAAAPAPELIIIDSYEENFSDFVINPAKIWSETRLVGGVEREPFTFSLDNGALKVDVDKNFTPDGTSTNRFVAFKYNISVDSLTVVDMNEYPYMSFRVKASEPISYRVQLFEPNATVNASGAMNRAALESSIPAANEWVEIFVDLTDKFIHVTNSNLDTVFIQDHLVHQFIMVPNFGDAGITWQGTVWVDDIKLGKAAEPIVVEPSTNNYLSAILVNETALEGFDKETLAYDVMLPGGTSTVPVVTATAEDALATLVVTPAAELPGTTTILVTAEDESTREYKINFTVDDTSVEALNARSVVYPNPASDFIKIESPVAIKSFAVFTLDGRVTNVDTSDLTMIKIHHLPQGMYLISIEYMDGLKDNKTFIKR